MAVSHAEEFLSEYRKLESFLRAERGPEASVRDLEDEMPDEADRLRYCRQTRNFVSHSPEPFPVPKEMCAYMKRVRAETEKAQKTVLQCSSRVKPLTPDGTLAEASGRLLTHPVMPVVDGGGFLLGFMTERTVVKRVSDGAAPSDRIDRAFETDLRNIAVDCGAPYSGIEWRGRRVLIAVDGSGKYRGIVRAPETGGN